MLKEYASSPVVELHPKADTDLHPRGKASRQAVLAAARKSLIASGWHGFSADEVTHGLKASREDIQNWWATPACIAIEAAIDVIESPTVPLGLTLDRQLVRIIQPIIDIAQAGDGATLLRSALLASSDDHKAGELFRKWFNSNFRHPLKSVLAEAAARGQIRREYDVDIAFELLFGPIWHRLVIMRGPLPELVALRAANGLMAALRP